MCCDCMCIGTPKYQASMVHCILLARYLSDSDSHKNEEVQSCHTVFGDHLVWKEQPMDVIFQ